MTTSGAGKTDIRHVETAADGGSRDQIDPTEARAIMRKIDWRIIPLLQLLYMLTFLDRVNIGNARLWNLEKDLGLEGYEYNVAVLVFFIPYIILELPATYVFNRVEPRKFIGIIMLGWGSKTTSLSSHSQVRAIPLIQLSHNMLAPRSQINRSDRIVLPMADNYVFTGVYLDKPVGVLFRIPVAFTDFDGFTNFAGILEANTWHSTTIVTITFAGFCQNFAGLLVSRIFVGTFEAGMFPGCMYLISGWYKRHELLTRMAFFFVANDIAGTISGLLGAGLGSLDGIRGISGWRWIFFIEGAVTYLAALIAWIYVPPFPEESNFLTLSDKQWVIRRLQKDNRGMSHERMTTKGVFKSLKDWKVLSSGVLYLAVCTTAYAISVFQPTILRTFGWGDLKSNLLSAPPRVASGIVSVALGIWSDRIQRRGVFCVFGFSLSIVGLILVMLLTGAMRYIGIYFAAIGIYIVQPLSISWCANQVTSSTKRGTITAYAGSIGQLGGIVSAVVFPFKDEPQYAPGISTCIAFQVLGIVVAANMWVCCAYENRQRDLGNRDHLRQVTQDEQDKLGENHPDFRYTL